MLETAIKHNRKESVIYYDTINNTKNAVAVKIWVQFALQYFNQ